MACKIVHVSSGAEIVKHVKMLGEHFDCVGSPVMIGRNIVTVCMYRVICLYYMSILPVS